MIILIDKGISPEATTKLTEYQKAVDDKPSYAERVTEAKRKFKSVNIKTNKTFAEVKTQLSAMCCGPDRCNYCEDSKADEVEHIKPKDWYPDVCFNWSNYCYACGPCNGPKNNKYALFRQSDGHFIELERSVGSPIEAPPLGDDVLINPRIEDPLDFLFLDLINKRYMFTEKHAKGTKEYMRAEYTKNILGLNSRSYLVKARKNAYYNFKARLTEYLTQKTAGVHQAHLSELIENLKEEHHQTVWQEMKRQYIHIPEINNLFEQAPEALLW